MKIFTCRYFEQLATVNDKEDSYGTWVDADSPPAGSPECEEQLLNIVLEHPTEGGNVSNQRNPSPSSYTQGIPIPVSRTKYNSSSSNTPPTASSSSPNFRSFNPANNSLETAMNVTKSELPN
jgi:hypothetical protein